MKEKKAKYLFGEISDKIADTQVRLDEVSVFSNLKDKINEDNIEENFGEMIPEIRKEMCTLDGQFQVINENVKSLFILTKDFLNDAVSEQYPIICGKSIKLKSIIDNSTNDKILEDREILLNGKEVTSIDLTDKSPSYVFTEVLPKTVSDIEDLSKYFNDISQKFVDVLEKHNNYPGVDFKHDFTIIDVKKKMESWDRLYEVYPEILSLISPMTKMVRSNIKTFNELLDHLENDVVEL